MFTLFALFIIYGIFFLLAWNARTMFRIRVRNWRFTPPCYMEYYSWFYALHFCDKLSFSLTGILAKKLLRLWFSGVYCLRRKMQKAQSFLTAIFGYVLCSDHEPMLFYTDRTTFVDHEQKTNGGSSKSRVVCIIATASVHANLFQMFIECFGMSGCFHSVQDFRFFSSHIFRLCTKGIYSVAYKRELGRSF